LITISIFSVVPVALLVVVSVSVNTVTECELSLVVGLSHFLGRGISTTNPSAKELRIWGYDKRIGGTAVSSTGVPAVSAVNFKINKKLTT
jgi:hypothetical protein